MSVQAVGWVMEQPVPPAAKLVLVSIANHADRIGRESYPSQESIAIESTMGERTVRRHIAWLDEQGWIVRYRRGRPDGTGRSSDGYELPGMTGETAAQARQRLARDGRSVILPARPVEPVDNRAQPANLAGSDRQDPEGSTGQSMQLNRPIRAAQPANVGRGTVLNRPEPEEEEEEGARADDHPQPHPGAETLGLLVGALPRRLRARLRGADGGLPQLHAALADLEAAGWPPDQAVDRLTANPLADRRGRDVDSVAAVLAYRARQLAAEPPPTLGAPTGPDPDCGACHGTGTRAATVPGSHGRPDVTAYGPCPCRQAA